MPEPAGYRPPTCIPGRDAQGWSAAERRPGPEAGAGLTSAFCCRPGPQSIASVGKPRLPLQINPAPLVEKRFREHKPAQHSRRHHWLRPDQHSPHRSTQDAAGGGDRGRVRYGRAPGPSNGDASRHSPLLHRRGYHAARDEAGGRPSADSAGHSSAARPHRFPTSRARLYREAIRGQRGGCPSHLRSRPAMPASRSAPATVACSTRSSWRHAGV